MMGLYDEQLNQLLEQCSKKKKLRAKEKELRAQQNSFAARAKELARIAQKEQADVDRLEGHSLSAFFYNMLGKTEEKMEKEQREAYAAQIKYDAAVRELDGIQRDLRRCEEELKSLQNCEERYASLLREKTQAVKKAGGSAAEQILHLEERAAYLKSQKNELREAIDAGQQALETVDQIADHLDSASGWGTWDLVGGGLLSDLVKYGHLDEALALVEQLQSQLRQFKTELADVTVDADFKVGIDGFLRVADCFFDGFFADWAVLSQIQHSQEQVQETRDQIVRLLNHLATLVKQAAAERKKTKEEIEQLVRSVPM